MSKLFPAINDGSSWDVGKGSSSIPLNWLINSLCIFILHFVKEEAKSVESFLVQGYFWYTDVGVFE
jgi:precorrin-6B methylase 2